MNASISQIDFTSLDGLKKEFNDVCTLELTVTTGLEEVAALECKERLNVETLKFRGRVVIDIEIDRVSEIFKLRSIDNISILICAEKFSFPNNREECFKMLFGLAESPDWRKGIRVFRSALGLDDSLDAFEQDNKLVEGDFETPRPERDLKRMKNSCEILENLPDDVKQQLKQNVENETTNGNGSHQAGPNPNESNSQKEKHGLKFRVTCHRVGASHHFGSSEAARQFGGGINAKFGWPVDLTHYKLEVLLNIVEELVYVAIGLTRAPLFKRNLSHFGPTNLRATIAYALVRLANPTPGDIVVDPMCGGASIPIEGSLCHQSSFHIGGEITDVGSRRSQNNVNHLLGRRKNVKTDILQWDATALPFRSQSVDAVVSDLPFGKRSGSKTDNRVLYFESLVEAARITKVTTGRAVLLTQDKNSMIKALMRLKSLWKNFSVKTINIGGLTACIYLLQRTSLISDPTLDVKPSKKIQKPAKLDDSEAKGVKRKSEDEVK